MGTSNTGGRTMALRNTTLQRMDERAAEIVDQFQESVNHFYSQQAFTGPSLYFHRKTIGRLHDHGGAGKAIASDRFVESVYATLTAWGMHRMGSRGAKLVEFNEFVTSLRSARDGIVELEGWGICDLPETDAPHVAGHIWSLISSGIEVSATKSRMVAGTKALHHFLPELVPPFDRQHTLRHFLGRKVFGGAVRKNVFTDVFKCMARIGASQRSVITGLVGQDKWNTSTSKVIDNAVVGFVRNHPRYSS